jgi:hypothetical protein
MQLEFVHTLKLGGNQDQINWFSSQMDAFLNKTDTDITDGEVLVKYTVDLDIREWGIKDISVVVQSAKANLNWKDETDEIGTIEIETGKDGWEINSQIEVVSSFICPDLATINFKTKTITIGN